jgi:hypothetical protein
MEEFAAEKDYFFLRKGRSTRVRIEQINSFTATVREAKCRVQQKLIRSLSAFRGEVFRAFISLSGSDMISNSVPNTSGGESEE